MSSTQIKILNLTFTIINAADCKSAFSHFILGMFEIQRENYEETFASLEEVFKEISLIDQVLVNNQYYAIEKFVCSDMKLLLNLFGLNQANSDKSCFICTFDYKAEQGLRKVDKPKPRTLEDAIKNQGKDGYVNFPVQNCIEFDHAIPDLLHLQLRISDLLFTMFLERLDFLDGEVTDYDVESRTHLQIFNSFLKNICKINKPIYISKKKQVKLRALSGGDRIKLFEIFCRVEDNGNRPYEHSQRYKQLRFYKTETKLIEGEGERKIIIPAKVIINSKEHKITVRDIQYLSSTDLCWRNYYQIYKTANKKLNEIDLKEFQQKLNSWVEDYKELEGSSKLTAYIHIFRDHIPLLIKKYGDINRFKIEGLESLNHYISQDFHHQTNKRSEQETPYLMQLIKKTNRCDLHNLNISHDFFD